jgi:8-oxo-dGTP pyrophosphatase MutT (NUDIX family)
MPTPEFVLKLREKIGHDLLLLPGVTGVVVNDAGEVLLVRSRNTQEWTPIGGVMEPHEEPADTLVREICEETGVTAVPERIVSVDALDEMQYPNGDRACYLTTTFLCRAVSGTPKVADEESTAVRYFAPDALPPMKPRHRRRIGLALGSEQRAAFTCAGVDHPRAR